MFLGTRTDDVSFVKLLNKSYIGRTKTSHPLITQLDEESRTLEVEIPRFDLILISSCNFFILVSTISLRYGKPAAVNFCFNELAELEEDIGA